MAEPSDMLVTIQSGKVAKVFQAVTRVNGANAVEISSEPGAVGKVGPRLARKLSFVVTCFDADIDNDGTPIKRPLEIGGEASATAGIISAQEQFEYLDSLVGKSVQISARGAPMQTTSGVIAWVIEAVNPKETTDLDNAFAVEVTVTELVNGTTSGNGSSFTFLGFGTLFIPPVDETSLVAGPIAPPKQVVVGGGECIAASVTRRADAGLIQDIGDFFAKAQPKVRENISVFRLAATNNTKSIGSAISNAFKTASARLTAHLKSTDELFAEAEVARRTKAGQKKCVV